MSVVAALLVLVAVLLVVDLALTAGIVRRLRAGGSVVAAPVQRLPAVGTRVDLDRDGAAWPAPARGMLHGVTVAALVLPGCFGCGRLQREIDEAGGLPVPLYVIGDPTVEGVADHLASWSGATAVLAPLPADQLASFDRPDTFPTVVLLDGGIVRAAGYRLADLTPALTSALAGRGTRRVAT